MSKGRSITLWFLAFFLTLATAIYQRMTGPTYPLRGKETALGARVRYHFERSGTSFLPLPVTVACDAKDIHATLLYRHFPSDETWTAQPMSYTNRGFSATLPGQPRAGKLEYSVVLERDGQRAVLCGAKAVVVRFKGEVPFTFLIIHIVFMFSGMLLAVRTGLEALHTNGNSGRLALWTLLVMAIGGLMFGPIVQKYAFGHFWTGFPFGMDLTDNKTLLAVVFWVGALLLRKKSRWWVAAASLLMIAVFLIPHSLNGSQLDYKTGKVITGR